MNKKLLFLLSLILCLSLSGCACKEHSWGPWQFTAYPSCTAEGAETRRCTECDEGAETRAVPMTAHDWAPADCLKPETCRSCGGTQGAALGHSFGDWLQVTAPACEQAGSRSRICARCSQAETEEVAALVHDWSEATCAAPAACALCRATRGEALPHTMEHQICTACGALDPEHPLAGRWTLLAVVQGEQELLTPTNTIYIDYNQDSTFLFNVQGMETRGTWAWAVEEGPVIGYVMTVDADGSMMMAALTDGYLAVTDQTAADTLIYQKAAQ